MSIMFDDDSMGCSWNIATANAEIERLEALIAAKNAELTHLRDNYSWHPASEHPKAVNGTSMSHAVLMQTNDGNFTDDFYSHSMNMWWKTRDAAMRWTELPPKHKKENMK